MAESHHNKVKKMKKIINKIMDKFGYESGLASFGIIRANGDEYVKAVMSSGMLMSYMLLADHLFGAAVELLDNNNEGFSEENNGYIRCYNAGAIEPPVACGLLIGYIKNHPNENEYSLFNLAIRCVKAAEVKMPE